jgi:hypothetical protein
MTREKFIKKWLSNKDYQYTEHNRDLMRDDLDELINQALRQPLVSGSLPYPIEVWDGIKVDVTFKGGRLVIQKANGN